MQGFEKIAIIGIVSVLGACAGGTRADLARLGELEQRIEAETPPTHVEHPLTLPELIELSHKSARSLDRIELEGMAARAAIEDEYAAGRPTVSVGLEVGRPDFVRSAASAGFVNLAPAINWNVIRQLQSGRLRALEASVEEHVAARRELERQALASETARLYFQRAIAKARLSAAELAEPLALRRVALSYGEDSSETRDRPEDAAARRAAAIRQFAYADDALRRACHIARDQPIADYSPPIREVALSAAPLDKYVAKVLTTHALGRAMAAEVAIKKGGVAAAKAERWNRFALRSGLPNILNLLSGSPLALLGYSASLIDQGAQARRELRARVEATMARIDGAEGLDELARNAAEVWLRRLDTLAELETAGQSAARAHRTAAIADAQYSAFAIDGSDHAQFRESQLAADLELEVRQLEASYAAFEYDLLLASSPADGETV